TARGRGRRLRPARRRPALPIDWPAQGSCTSPLRSAGRKVRLGVEGAHRLCGKDRLATAGPPPGS
ncbi:MAG: hypothetical protein AB7O57_12215, partial [Hyphomicrobiaceae bacterium]